MQSKRLKVASVPYATNSILTLQLIKQAPSILANESKIASVYQRKCYYYTVDISKRNDDSISVICQTSRPLRITSVIRCAAGLSAMLCYFLLCCVYYVLCSC